VIDTNVVVSALLSPHAPPAEVLRLSLQGELVMLYDHRILAEYRDVLSRPVFGFDPDDISALVNGVEWTGELVFAKALAIELPDPDDTPFLEVAVAGGADALITGNVRHFRRAGGRVEVITPRDLVDGISRTS
jgi:putative PIN family toxin of toxin-antitoxin system